MNSFHYLFFVFLAISFIQCSQHLSNLKSKQASPIITVSPVYISPFQDYSLFLNTLDVDVNFYSLKVGKQIGLSKNPELFYINTDKGLIRNFFFGNVLEVFTGYGPGGYKSPNYIVSFRTATLENLSNRKLTISQTSKNTFRIVARVKASVGSTQPLVDKDYALTFTNGKITFEPVGKSLDSQKWRIASYIS